MLLCLHRIGPNIYKGRDEAGVEAALKDLLAKHDLDVNSGADEIRVSKSHSACLVGNAHQHGRKPSAVVDDHAYQASLVVLSTAAVVQQCSDKFNSNAFSSQLSRVCSALDMHFGCTAYHGMEGGGSGIVYMELGVMTC